MTQNIYYIENRGFRWLFHFVIFMVGGLHLINDQDDKIKIYMPYLLENIDPKDWNIINLLTKEPHTYVDHQILFIKEIYNINVSFQILDLIKDKYEIIYSIKDYDINNYNLIHHYGEALNWPYVPTYASYNFLRKLFIKNDNKLCKGKYIYISRNNSDKVAHYNITQRKILNENEIYNSLKLLNFEIIYLEDLTFLEKIEIFQKAEIILATCGTGLLFTMFCNINSCVIEIFPEYINPPRFEYTKHMTECIGNKYIKFNDAKKMNEYNDMIIDNEKLIHTIKDTIDYYK